MKNKKTCKLNLNIAYLIPVIIGFVLTLVGIFGKELFDVLEPLAIPFKLFGVLIMSVTWLVSAIKSDEKPALKSIGILTLTAIVLTWLIPHGQFAQQQFMDQSYQRFGLSDVAIVLYYALYFNLDKIIFLLQVSALYYMLSQTKAYQKLIANIAKGLKGIETYITILFATLFILLTSFVSHTLIVFLFVPFALSILSKLKIDKLTTFAVTFGAILVGLVGVPFGSEGLRWFGYYSSIDGAEGLKYRLILQAIVLVGYLVFLFVRQHLATKKKIKAVAMVDPYEVKDNRAKVSTIPLIVIFSLFTVLILLGYIDWYSNFNITVFKDFHTWLTELSIAEHPIFAYILGTSATEFGSWDIITGIVVMFIFSFVVALANKVKIKEILKSYEEGFKIMIKPVLYFTAVSFVFVVLYSTPFLNTFLDWAYGLTEGLNPAISSLSAMITSAFHPDLGYTGYLVGGYITSAFSENIGIVHTIFISAYGFMQIFVPTSALLILGLELTETSYKDWIKYIFIFLIALFVVLQAFLVLITYLV